MIPVARQSRPVAWSCRGLLARGAHHALTLAISRHDASHARQASAQRFIVPSSPNCSQASAQAAQTSAHSNVHILRPYRCRRIRGRGCIWVGTGEANSDIRNRAVPLTPRAKVFGALRPPLSREGPPG